MNSIYILVLIDCTLSNIEFRKVILDFVKELSQHMDSIPNVCYSISFYNDHIKQVKGYDQSFEIEEIEDVPFNGKTSTYTVLKKAARNLKRCGDHTMMIVINDGDLPNIDLNYKKDCYKAMRDIQSICLSTTGINKLKGLYKEDIPFSENDRVYDSIDEYIASVEPEPVPELVEEDMDVVEDEIKDKFETIIEPINLENNEEIRLELSRLEYLLERMGS